jgi:hypothetical protein
MEENTPSGWFPNPADPGEEIYWDGAAWSGATRPVLENGAGLATPALSAPPAGRREGRNGLGVAALGVGIFAIVVAAIPGPSFFAWIVALPAVGLGIAGLTRRQRSFAEALAGLIEGAVAILLGIIVSVNFMTNVGAQ